MYQLSIYWFSASLAMLHQSLWVSWFYTIRFRTDEENVCWDIKAGRFCDTFVCVCMRLAGGGGGLPTLLDFCFSCLCSADFSSKDLCSSSHIWLLCVTLVMTLLEGQRWPPFSVTAEANADLPSVNCILGIQSPKIHASRRHQENLWWTERAWCLIQKERKKNK